MMVSIIASGELCSGAKALGWEHSNGTLKSDFENLGIVLYSTECFQENVFCEMEKRRRMIYEKGHCV
jgi:hypothetical protein